ncbi:MAG: iron export ABC transporter permease subunit FetB [Deferrisomatales bacterium]|nr:iron export ABC transporter permease subunit FetB [Deferrisomatales bacterium]
MTGAQPIGPWELALASSFLLVAAGLSLALSLGLVQDLLVAAGRTYIQLLALGFVLRWVFGVGSPWLVVGILALMIVVATHTALSRVRHRPPGLFLSGLGALLLTGITVTLAVTGLIIRVEPWYLPRYVIPLGGMVIGNAMNGVAVSLERLFHDLSGREAEILALLALGATPWEAVRPSARTAVRSGLIPTINSMSAAGIVFIPGMMTGQVLSGTDPRIAAAYQIVVLLMIAAATAGASILAVVTGYRRVFDDEARFVGGEPPRR